MMRTEDAVKMKGNIAITPVFTWRVPGIWYDIGSKEALEEANRIFAQTR